jgi:tRNA 2-thiouridine synthesizing protein A
MTWISTKQGGILMSDTILENEIMEFHKELDARGLNCPLPILKAKKALTELRSGEVLRIMATDPGSVRDFQAFAKQTGNALLSHVQNGREFVFLMQRK